MGREQQRPYISLVLLEACLQEAAFPFAGLCLAANLSRVFQHMRKPHWLTKPFSHHVVVVLVDDGCFKEVHDGMLALHNSKDGQQESRWSTQGHPCRLQEVMPHGLLFSSRFAFVQPAFLHNFPPRLACSRTSDHVDHAMSDAAYLSSHLRGPRVLFD